MKSILLTVAMLVTTLTAAAQWMKPTVESKGDFVVGDTVYLYNTGAQMFLTQGNAYGTQSKCGRRRTDAEGGAVCGE